MPSAGGTAGETLVASGRTLAEFNTGASVGQGGSAPQAAVTVLPSATITIRDVLERSIKGGIIMVRRIHTGRKTLTLHMLETDARLALIHAWLSRDLRLEVLRIEPASSDASFRRYFRAFCPETTYVVMDAPPGKEDVRPYLKVAALLESVGAHVPRVHSSDPDRGLVLIEDLGGTLYLERLAAGDDPDPLYADALDVLAAIQVRGRAACAALAPYGRAELLREMALLPEWFLAKHLALTLTPAERQLLDDTFEFLIREALAQPTVFVHRDYHSRNLMVVGERNPGIVDFQDALCGPVGYDLVSLLKDCYISWPRERVLGWLRGFRQRLIAMGGEAGASETEFVRWFDLIGVQRHIKVLGIFCRLWYRDGKNAYLGDLPRTLEYVRDACARYQELTPLGRFLEARVVGQLPRVTTLPPAMRQSRA
ncbi:MAG TPA: phosphotransferase [Steroidobacteraceae bacterium]|nr:phosphotransferase [Steroidobacteraceae bacterium]